MPSRTSRQGAPGLARSSPILSESHDVARWVAKRADADAVALVHRLLEHLRTGSGHVLEGGVAVVGSEDDGAQHALGQELRHHLLVLRWGRSDWPSPARARC